MPLPDIIMISLLPDRRRRLYFDVLTAMMPVAGSWKAIDRGLRIDSGRLETINDSNSGRPKECLSEMLTCWLKRNYSIEQFGEPTWRAVV